MLFFLSIYVYFSKYHLVVRTYTFIKTFGHNYLIDGIIIYIYISFVVGHYEKVTETLRMLWTKSLRISGLAPYVSFPVKLWYFLFIVSLIFHSEFSSTAISSWCVCWRSCTPHWETPLSRAWSWHYGSHF